MTLGDKIIVMNQGDIQQVGTPHEVFFSPLNAFVANFVGTPSMNMLPGRARAGDDGVWRARLPGFELRLPARFNDSLTRMPGDELLWGIRPEAIRLASEAGENCVAGEVELVEALGSRDLIFVRVDEQLFGVIIDARAPAQVGENVILKFDDAAMPLIRCPRAETLCLPTPTGHRHDR